MQKLANVWKKNRNLTPHTTDNYDLIIGPASGTEGLARAARNEIERLLKAHPATPVIDTLTQSTNDTAGLVQKALSSEAPSVLILGQPDTYEQTLAHLDPNTLAKCIRTGFIVWELPYCPSEWMFIREILHSFLTLSQYSADALTHGLELPARVVPSKVSVARNDEQIPRQFARENGFNGLAIMDLRSCPDRKNPWAVVQAWQRAFGDDGSCQLLLKTRFSKRTEFVREELRAMIGSSSNIRIVEDVLSDDDIARLYSNADVYVSLHRAEGYGLTIREALETGVPSVVTNWSAPVEYLSNYPMAYAIDYTLAPCRDFMHHYKGAKRVKWAEANVDSAALVLQRLARRVDTIEPTSTDLARCKK